MKLTQVRKFNGLVLYGYIFETPMIYWSMNFYGHPIEKSVALVEYIHAHRFTELHAGIVL